MASVPSFGMEAFARAAISRRCSVSFAWVSGTAGRWVRSTTAFCPMRLGRFDLHPDRLRPIVGQVVAEAVIARVAALREPTAGALGQCRSERHVVTLPVARADLRRDRPAFDQWP